MKKILALSIFFLFTLGCTTQIRTEPNPANEPAQPAPRIEAIQTEFSRASIRYDIINEEGKTSMLLENDGSVTITSKKNGSQIKEMTYEKIDQEKARQIVLELSGKDFFSYPDYFGDFGAGGTTKVLELSVDGKTKNIACHDSCPSSLDEAIKKIEEIARN